MKELIENPRFLDRLNAVCTVIMAAALVMLILLAAQAGTFASIGGGASAASHASAHATAVESIG